eukprot:TRINITY_DN15043_c0_g1_i1.p1 TRINITY_DN15043_c0_g1~~TRINITY_DN15043_c0_g1_i1.p1  ORF type:complete len:292 (-),score=87.20 TRINITY_DN15043_c0_g1_i1:46-921(-)
MFSGLHFHLSLGGDLALKKSVTEIIKQGSGSIDFSIGKQTTHFVTKAADIIEPTFSTKTAYKNGIFVILPTFFEDCVYARRKVDEWNHMLINGKPALQLAQTMEDFVIPRFLKGARKVLSLQNALETQKKKEPAPIIQPSPLQNRSVLVPKETTITKTTSALKPRTRISTLGTMKRPEIKSQYQLRSEQEKEEKKIDIGNSFMERAEAKRKERELRIKAQQDERERKLEEKRIRDEEIKRQKDQLEIQFQLEKKRLEEERENSAKLLQEALENSTSFHYVQKEKIDPGNFQ